MKTKLLMLSFCLLFFVGGSVKSYAQVNVGLGEAAEKYATLQIKDKETVTSNPLNAPTAEKGGLLLPRVELQKKKELLPFVTQTEVDNNYQTYQDAKLAHTGLIVYNLIEDDDEELCLGLNQWDGEQWNCFQQKMGNAIAELGNCDSLKFIGQYLNDVSLGAGNYMTIPLHVTKAGAYTITAMPDPDNGYYFTVTGVFLTTGYYFLSIPGAGTPLNFQTDQLKITFNGKSLDACDPLYITVEDSSKKPYYVMDCSSVNVKGVYQINKPLDITKNYIEVNLEVDIAAVGATYIIETNTVDGIYFKASGLLTGTVQTIKLLGYGTPTSIDEKEMTITSNSATTVATCKATVSIALATKVTYGWGHYNNTAGYIMQMIGSTPQGTRRIVDAKVNFGTDENSTVKVVRYSDTQTFNHSILYGELNGLAAYEPTQIKAMFDQKPEVILAGFDLDIAATNRSTVAGYMVDYLNAGGVLVLPLERSTMAVAFFNALYPGLTVSTTWLTTPTFQFGFVSDEILNGPFGDIRGKLWGNDTLGAISIKGIPEEDIVVYSRDSSGNPMIFKHKYYNLLFIGEGGVFANYNGIAGSTGGTASGSTSYPVAFDNNYVPITRTNFGSASVENGRLFGNIMAWAINQAQFNGINTK